jgi:hypothetical protein
VLEYRKRTGSIEVDWTIERGRQLATGYTRTMLAGDDPRMAYSPAEQTAVLVWETWKAKAADMEARGWRNQETIRDAVTHLVHAYQGLAAAFGAAYVMGEVEVDECNGAEVDDPRRGARGRA